MAIKPLVFTASEVAVMLGVTSTKTIVRYVKRGWLPKPLRIGMKKVWTKPQIDAFLTRATAGEFKPQKLPDQPDAKAKK